MRESRTSGSEGGAEQPCSVPTPIVPVSQVASVKEALVGHQRFQALAQEFIDLTVAMTRAEQTAAAKKNSKRSRPSATGKPKAS